MTSHVGPNFKQPRILVTGIGGNVAQGILRNIRSCCENSFLVGTNVASVSSGNYLCDRVFEVPYSTEEDYIPQIKRICIEYNIQLIIPSTDLETLYLGLAQSELPSVACIDPQIGKIFLDKYLTANEFKKFSIPFAETTLPSQFINVHDDFIVKPREGRGSRGLHINPPNPRSFSDDFIVQRLYKGQEITTAFYVTKIGSLLGSITMERSLSNGTTSECLVSFKYARQINEIIEKMLSVWKIRGSCNIQSIVTDDGEVIPFEINGRISGTNSVRSNFGFNDTLYTLQEHLFDEVPQRPSIKKGAAIRVLLDVIFPEVESLSEVKDQSTKHFIF